MRRWITKDNALRSGKEDKNLTYDNLILARGNIDSWGMKNFLSRENQGLQDPFLIQDMDRAVKRVDAAIKSVKKITLYGEYSLQGILGTAMLYRAFGKLGVDINYYIDDSRESGLGLTCCSIDYIKSLATELIIFVATGASSAYEIKYCRESGMDAIVLDNRIGKNLGQDIIFINPAIKTSGYPNSDLLGSGISFKLIQGLWKYYGLASCEDILDIGILGISNNDNEQKGENKIISRIGLERFRNSDKYGIQALKSVVGLKGVVSLEQISEKIFPIIDSAWRIYDPRILVELLTTSDYDKAMQIAKYLVKEIHIRYKTGIRALWDEF